MKISPVIYGIVNLENNKLYVGQTINFQKRQRAHCYALRRCDHRCSHLQRAWNKYGEDNFEFFVLEDVLDVEQLNAREQYWIDLYKDDGVLYNTALIAESSRRGVKLSKETRRKLSLAHMGNKLSDKALRLLKERNNKNGFRAKEYKFVSPSGEVFIGTNAAKFSREHDLNPRSMANVMSGYQQSHKGWTRN